MKVTRKVILFTLIVTAVVYGDEIEGKTRSKRALKQFGDMVKFTTNSNKKLTDFNGYGNYCGILGDGQPVDEIDTCCKVHDECLKPINRRVCLPFFYVAFYIIPYRWYSVGDQIYCSPVNTNCQLALCACDKVAAECFATHEAVYNPLYKQ